LARVVEKMNHWLSEHYGSRRGFVRTYWHRIRYYLGAYRQYRDIDWQSIERVVFVCKGNICRSAYAEAVARSLGIETVSCGLETIENAPANEVAIRAAKKRGFDLGGHKTQPVMYLLLKKTDLLVAMEPWQCVCLVKNLVRVHSYTLLGLWAGKTNPHIQDPYGSSPEYFDRCFASIEQQVHEITKKLKK